MYWGHDMTKKLNREAIINWATSRGWELDRYGNLQKEVNGKQYRLKLSSVAVRNEVKVNHSDGTSEWMRLISGYYKDLFIAPDGKLSGMRSRKESK